MVGKSKRNTRKNTRRNTMRNSRRNTRRNRNTRANLRRNTSRNRNTRRRNNRKNNRKNRNNRRNKNGGIISWQDYVLIDEGNTLDRNHLYVGVSDNIPGGGTILKVKDKRPLGFNEKALSEFHGLKLYKSIKNKSELHEYEETVYSRDPKKLAKLGPLKASRTVVKVSPLEDIDFYTIKNQNLLETYFDKVDDTEVKTLTIGCRNGCP